MHRFDSSLVVKHDLWAICVADFILDDQLSLKSWSIIKKTYPGWQSDLAGPPLSWALPGLPQERFLFIPPYISLEIMGPMDKAILRVECNVDLHRHQRILTPSSQQVKFRKQLSKKSKDVR